MRAALLALLLLLAGCADAKDASRAAVLSVAGAERIVEHACTAVVAHGVQESQYLSRSQIQAVLQAGTVCAMAIETARPLLETAAVAVDGPGQWSAACATLKAATVLAGAVAAVRQVGGTVPAEVDEALKAGKFVGASCSAI